MNLAERHLTGDICFKVRSKKYKDVEKDKDTDPTTTDPDSTTEKLYLTIMDLNPTTTDPTTEFRIRYLNYVLLCLVCFQTCRCFTDDICGRRYFPFFVETPQPTEH